MNTYTLVQSKSMTGRIGHNSFIADIMPTFVEMVEAQTWQKVQ